MSIGQGSPWATFTEAAMRLLENPTDTECALAALGTISLCSEVAGDDEAISLVIKTGYTLALNHPRMSLPFGWPHLLTIALLYQVADDAEIQRRLDKVAGELEIEPWQLAPVFSGAASQQAQPGSDQYQRHWSRAIMNQACAEQWREFARPDSGMTITAHPFSPQFQAALQIAARLNQLLGS